MDTCFYKECFLLNIYHYEALSNWENIKIGTELKVSKSSESEKKDVVVLQLDAKTIGELSKEDSRLILDFLNMGWTDNNNQLFTSRVCCKYDEGDENKKIKVVIYIKKATTTSGTGENQ